MSLSKEIIAIVEKLTDKQGEFIRAGMKDEDTSALALSFGLKALWFEFFTLMRRVEKLERGINE